MDWRDFMRGFFGGGTRNRSGGDQWPPPPPIENFFRQEGGASVGGNGGDGERGVFFEGGRENRRRGGGAEEFGGGFEDFGGNRFVFGDLFSAMGEMFREMERSMKDMDSFFEGHPGGFGGGVMIPALPGPSPSLEDNPKAPSQVPKNKEENIRDLVLKEPEVSPQGRGNSRHYIPPPKEKVDRDLDDLHQQSKLDLSDLPVPVPSQQSEASTGVLSPFGSIFGGSDGHARGHSTFQRTYQTFSFKNGRWEGEIIKEDQNGKEVTRYYQDAQGKKHETTEYFPSSSEGSITSSPSLAIKDKPEDNHRPSSLFPFFERFFKPKM